MQKKDESLHLDKTEFRTPVIKQNSQSNVELDYSSRLFFKVADDTRNVGSL